jgi:threonine/homoserine/homoserine lactone efflux protein
MIPDNFLLFATAALLLNLTPGNDMIYVMARSGSQGTRAGIISALGISAGCLVHLAAAVAGLSAILAESAFAFSLIKYAGAAYLVYLGIRALSDRSALRSQGLTKERSSMKRIFWQGALTNLLNPKVALFFLAFLPQFIGTGTTQPASRILFMGIWFNMGGTLVNMTVAFLFLFF